MKKNGSLSWEEFFKIINPYINAKEPERKRHKILASDIPNYASLPPAERWAAFKEAKEKEDLELKVMLKPRNDANKSVLTNIGIKNYLVEDNPSVYQYLVRDDIDEITFNRIQDFVDKSYINFVRILRETPNLKIKDIDALFDKYMPIISVGKPRTVKLEEEMQDYCDSKRLPEIMKNHAKKMNPVERENFYLNTSLDTMVEHKVPDDLANNELFLWKALIGDFLGYYKIAPNNLKDDIVFAKCLVCTGYSRAVSWLSLKVLLNEEFVADLKSFDPTSSELIEMTKNSLLEDEAEENNKKPKSDDKEI